MPSISVSWATYRRLVERGEAEGFGRESELEDVLNRLLESESTDNEGAWTHSGVRLEEGALLRINHLDREFMGAVRDGLLQFGDVHEDSPSKAAVKVIQNHTGKATSINGWIAIQAAVNTGQSKRWRKLSELRREAQEMA